MGKLVLRKTILRNMIDRVWAPLEPYCLAEGGGQRLLTPTLLYVPFQSGWNFWNMKYRNCSRIRKICDFWYDNVVEYERTK
jgi:hypothetical protein